MIYYIRQKNNPHLPFYRVYDREYSQDCFPFQQILAHEKKYNFQTEAVLFHPHNVMHYFFIFQPQIQKHIAKVPY